MRLSRNITTSLLFVLFLATSIDTAAQVRIVVQSESGSSLDTFDGTAATKAAVADSSLRNATSFMRLTDIIDVRSLAHRALVIDYADSASALLAMDQLATIDGVVSAEFSQTFSIDASLDDPLADSSLHHALISVPQAWSVTRGTREVRVGLVDTGLYFEHPDLAGQVWINPGEDLNGNGQWDASDLDGIDSDGNGWVDDIRGYDFVDRQEELGPLDFRFRDPDASDDGSGHGTNVAGILAAVADNKIGSAGIAPGVAIVPLRAFAADGIGTDVDIATAIIYGADMGLDVLNLSFGDVYESSLMRTAIEYAASQGTTIVASGGNTGGDQPHYPSDYADVISVVWLNEDGSAAAPRATHGVGIDVGAPGSRIFTTLRPSGDDVTSDSVLYGRRSGSSMAAPLVSGVAALLKSLNPNLRPANIRDIVTASATDIDAPGWDHKTASGRVNALAAVSSILPSRLEISFPTNNTGISSNTDVIGFVLHADLQSWTVQLAAGDSTFDDSQWNTIGGGESQRYDDQLAAIDIDELVDGVYTIRLVVTLRDGRAIEDRQRIYIDRTAPEVSVRYVGPALAGARSGLVVDLGTDDVTTAAIQVHGTTVESERLARIHGLEWIDTSLSGGTLPVEIVVSNTAGLETRIDTVVAVPAARPNTGLFDLEATDVPSGFMLQDVLDLDNDGLREIVFNRFEDGWLGDTLVVAEYSGNTFIPVSVQIANVFPRDAGDMDGDGQVDILTQVGPATLVLEQVNQDGFTLDASLVDTSSLANPSQSEPIWPAAFVDIDSDGADEVLTHNTSAIRILRGATGQFAEVLKIENPTSFAHSELDENSFEQPSILEGDFDGDGLENYLVGDGDGDLIMLEQDGGGSVVTTWTFETDRYSSATRYGAGDFDGDGTTDFVSYTRNWLASTGAGERETDLGIYYFWRSTGDDEFELEYTLGIPGVIDRHGSMGALDVDSDGDDELVLIDSPDLYVLDRLPGGHYSMVYHLAADSVSGPRSATMVVGDFGGAGQESVLFADADGFMKRLTPVSGAAQLPVPEWIAARPLGSESVHLEWASYGADSVTVFVSRSGSSFDPLTTMPDNSILDSTTVSSRYMLAGWFGGIRTALSPVRRVVPHGPAILVNINYPTSESVKLQFNDKLWPGTGSSHFSLTDGNVISVILADGGKSAIISVGDLPTSRSTTLRFLNLVDESGLPVAEDSVSLVFPDISRDFLVLSSWEVNLPDEVILEFSEAVASVPQPGPGNFNVSPVGRIDDVVLDAALPTTIRVTLSDVNMSAFGINPTLTVVDLMSESGKILASEGNTIRLTANATDLENVVIYPNPMDVSLHAEQVRFAGLPAGTSISIISVDGVHLRRFAETESSGEVVWDTRDKNGVLVPSGVYLVRFEHADSKDSVRKVAVIR